MDLRMFINLFQEIEVENLFKALDLCMEYARAFTGRRLQCEYDNRGTLLIRSIHGIRFTGNEVVL